MVKRLEFDPSLQLTWAIANAEAVAAGVPTIEPIHFLLAALEVLDEAFHQYAERMGLTAEAEAGLAPAIREAREQVGLSDEEITRLRRSLRKLLHGEQPGARPASMLRRSPALRDLFERAATLAALSRSPSLTLAHLVRTLMTDPPAELRDLLPAARTDKPQLAWETRINLFANRFQLSQLVFVMTDIENSMGVKRLFGDRESIKIFRAHDNLVREELARFAGATEIKSIGDGFLLAFTSEADAVRFALRVQSRLRGNADLAKIPVRVRMGIHAGETLSRPVGGGSLSDPVFGIAIDTSARISSLAVGNQILSDRGVYEKVHSEISAQPPEGVGQVEWRCHGPYRLKGLAEPVEIYEVGETGQAAFVKPGATEKAASLEAGRPALARGTTPFATRRPTPFLDLFGRDLTRLAREGRLAPLVGRSQEVKTLARYLQRTTKRNAVVIGEAGVGKTAVVEGLAQRLAAPEAPDYLQRLRIVQIAVGDLIAGAANRGDMEERMQRLLEEATADPDLILFFDEIHLVMKAGAGSGAPLDVANLLKPALARDDFRCIGATTTEEFERHIKPDAAFLRRFQVLRLSEPSEAEALEVCRTWARRIEEMQDVVLEVEAVEAAVSLSARLIRGRSLPDKAIDLLENAAAVVKVSSLSFRALAPTKEKPRVQRAHVEAALEEQYGISVRATAVLDAARVEAALQANLVGQEAAVAAIVETVRGLGAKEGSRAGTLGVLLFTGPTGVGKTFAAECLARALSSEERPALGRFNMSEFKDRHELARLTGAPPGFVGHEQAGALFRHVEAFPQGVILLDEMEKAHAEIQDYFLQVFDQGEALDSRGRKADFRRQLFVLTCNVGAETTSAPIGFHAGEAPAPEDAGRALTESLARYFRREFLARVDRVVEFRPLMEADYLILFERRARQLIAEVEARAGTKLEMEKAVGEHLAALASAQGEGARGFLRLFERLLAAPLERYLGEKGKTPQARVSWSGEAPSFSI